jgi:hypothetical protein
MNISFYHFCSKSNCRSNWKVNQSLNQSIDRSIHHYIKSEITKYKPSKSFESLLLKLISSKLPSCVLRTHRISGLGTLVEGIQFRTRARFPKIWPVVSVWSYRKVAHSPLSWYKTSVEYHVPVHFTIHTSNKISKRWTKVKKCTYIYHRFITIYSHWNKECKTNFTTMLS